MSGAQGPSPLQRARRDEIVALITLHAGGNQSEAARQLGVTARQVRRYFAGESWPEECVLRLARLVLPSPQLYARAITPTRPSARQGTRCGVGFD